MLRLLPAFPKPGELLSYQWCWPSLPDTYNEVDVTSDENVTSAQPFTPYMAETLDPRLDWTVGRRGVPYYDWGFHPGRDWIRMVTYGGPYSPKKNTFYKADEGNTA